MKPLALILSVILLFIFLSTTQSQSPLNQHNCLSYKNTGLDTERGFHRPPFANLTDRTVECNPLGTITAFRFSTNQVTCTCKHGFTGTGCQFNFLMYDDLMPNAVFHGPPEYILAGQELRFAIRSSGSSYIRFRWATMISFSTKYSIHPSKPLTTQTTSRLSSHERNSVYSNGYQSERIIETNVQFEATLGPMDSYLRIEAPSSNDLTDDITCLTLLGYEVQPDELNSNVVDLNKVQFQPVLQLTVFKSSRVPSISSYFTLSNNPIVCPAPYLITRGSTNNPECECPIKGRFGPTCSWVFHWPEDNKNTVLNINSQITGYIITYDLSNIPSILDVYFTLSKPNSVNSNVRMAVSLAPVSGKNDRFFFNLPIKNIIGTPSSFHITEPSIGSISYLSLAVSEAGSPFNGYQSNPLSIVNRCSLINLSCLSANTRQCDLIEQKCQCKPLFFGTYCQFELQVLTLEGASFQGIPGTHMRVHVFDHLDITGHPYKKSMLDGINISFIPTRSPDRILPIEYDTVANSLVAKVPAIDIVTDFQLEDISGTVRFSLKGFVDSLEIVPSGKNSCRSIPQSRLSPGVAGCFGSLVICHSGRVGSGCQYVHKGFDLTTSLFSISTDAQWLVEGNTFLMNEAPTFTYKISLNYFPNKLQNPTHQTYDISSKTISFRLPGPELSPLVRPDLPWDETTNNFALTANESAVWVSYLGLVPQTTCYNIPPNRIRGRLPCYQPHTQYCQVWSMTIPESQSNGSFCTCKQDFESDEGYTYLGPHCQTKALLWSPTIDPNKFTNGIDSNRQRSILHMTVPGYPLPQGIVYSATKPVNEQVSDGLFIQFGSTYGLDTFYERHASLRPSNGGITYVSFKYGSIISFFNMISTPQGDDPVKIHNHRDYRPLLYGITVGRENLCESGWFGIRCNYYLAVTSDQNHERNELIQIEQNLKFTISSITPISPTQFIDEIKQLFTIYYRKTSSDIDTLTLITNSLSLGETFEWSVPSHLDQSPSVDIIIFDPFSSSHITLPVNSQCSIAKKQYGVTCPANRKCDLTKPIDQMCTNECIPPYHTSDCSTQLTKLISTKAVASEQQMPRYAVGETLYFSCVYSGYSASSPPYAIFRPQDGRQLRVDVQYQSSGNDDDGCTLTVTIPNVISPELPPDLPNFVPFELWVERYIDFTDPARGLYVSAVINLNLVINDGSHWSFLDGLRGTNFLQYLQASQGFTCDVGNTLYYEGTIDSGRCVCQESWFAAGCDLRAAITPTNNIFGTIATLDLFFSDNAFYQQIPFQYGSTLPNLPQLLGYRVFYRINYAQINRNQFTTQFLSAGSDKLLFSESFDRRKILTTTLWSNPHFGLTCDSGNPCLFPGSQECAQLGTGQYKCLCHSNYFGPICDQRIDVTLDVILTSLNSDLRSSLTPTLSGVYPGMTVAIPKNAALLAAIGDDIEIYTCDGKVGEMRKTDTVARSFTLPKHWALLQGGFRQELFPFSYRKFGDLGNSLDHGFQPLTISNTMSNSRCGWLRDNLAPNNSKKIRACVETNVIDCDLETININNLCQCSSGTEADGLYYQTYGISCQHKVIFPVGPYYVGQHVQITVVTDQSWLVDAVPVINNAKLTGPEQIPCKIVSTMNQDGTVIIWIEIPDVGEFTLNKEYQHKTSEEILLSLGSFSLELEMISRDIIPNPQQPITPSPSTVKYTDFAVVEPCYWTAAVQHHTICAQGTNSNRDYISVSSCIDPETRWIKCNCKNAYFGRECRSRVTPLTSPIDDSGYYQRQMIDLSVDWLSDNYDNLLRYKPNYLGIGVGGSRQSILVDQDQLSTNNRSLLLHYDGISTLVSDRKDSPITLKTTPQTYSLLYTMDTPRSTPSLLSISHLEHQYSRLPNANNPQNGDIGQFVSKVYGLSCNGNTAITSGCFCGHTGVFGPDCSMLLALTPLTPGHKQSLYNILWRGGVEYQYRLSKIKSSYKSNQGYTWPLPLKYHFELSYSTSNEFDITRRMILSNSVTQTFTLPPFSTQDTWQLFLVSDDVNNPGTQTHFRSNQRVEYLIRTLMVDSDMITNQCIEENTKTMTPEPDRSGSSLLSCICHTGYGGDKCQYKILLDSYDKTIDSTLTDGLATIQFNLIQSDVTISSIFIAPFPSQAAPYTPSWSICNIDSAAHPILINCDIDIDTLKTTVASQYHLRLTLHGQPSTTFVLSTPINIVYGESTFTCSIHTLNCQPTIKLTVAHPLSTSLQPLPVINLPLTFQPVDPMPHSTADTVNWIHPGTPVTITIPHFDKLEGSAFISLQAYTPSQSGSYVSSSSDAFSVVLKGRNEQSFHYAIRENQFGDKLFFAITLPLYPGSDSPVTLYTPTFGIIPLCRGLPPNPLDHSDSSKWLSRCVEGSCQPGNNECQCPGKPQCTNPRCTTPKCFGTSYLPLNLYDPGSCPIYPSCKCPNFWSGLSCQSCQLQCRGGEPEANCSSCNCDGTGRFGPTCECHSTSFKFSVNGRNEIVMSYYMLFVQNITSTMSDPTVIKSLYDDINVQIAKLLAKSFRVDDTSFTVELLPRFESGYTGEMDRVTGTNGVGIVLFGCSQYNLGTSMEDLNRFATTATSSLDTDPVTKALFTYPAGQVPQFSLEPFVATPTGSFEDENRTDNKYKKILVIVLPIFGGLFLLITLIVVIAVLCKNHNKTTPGENQPCQPNQGFILSKPLTPEQILLTQTQPEEIIPVTSFSPALINIDQDDVGMTQNPIIEHYNHTVNSSFNIPPAIHNPVNHVAIDDLTLPPHFKGYKDSKGQVFYINTEDNTSSWAHPCNNS